MKLKFRTARILLTLGMCMIALAPGTALAHDNLGGDELAMSSLMLTGAVVVAAMAALALIWAARAGQFNNIEESKFSMLRTADEYDPRILENADKTGTSKRTDARVGDDAAPVNRVSNNDAALDSGQQVGR